MYIKWNWMLANRTLTQISCFTIKTQLQTSNSFAYLPFSLAELKSKNNNGELWVKKQKLVVCMRFALFNTGYSEIRWGFLIVYLMVTWILMIEQFPFWATTSMFVMRKSINIIRSYEPIIAHEVHTVFICSSSFVHIIAESH